MRFRRKIIPLKLYSSTQGPRATQFAACRVIGVGMHQVEVDVTRLGGGFGGKEDQANAWAAMCALAAYQLKTSGEIFTASNG